MLSPFQLNQPSTCLFIKHRLMSVLLSVCPPWPDPASSVPGEKLPLRKRTELLTHPTLATGSGKDTGQNPSSNICSCSCCVQGHGAVSSWAACVSACCSPLLSVDFFQLEPHDDLHFRAWQAGQCRSRHHKPPSSDLPCTLVTSHFEAPACLLRQGCL